MTPALPSRVTVVEVGPRDGLQNESRIVPPDERARFVNLLAEAGLPVIEIGAFVSPSWVPQMAGTDEVCALIERRGGTRYSALVPNQQGLERAAAAGMTDIAIFAAASETFSRRNINCSVDASLAAYAAVCGHARELSIGVRAYLSTAFGCPYEGDVPAERVAGLCRALLDMGAFEVAISDTIGVAHPRQVWEVLDAVVNQVPVHQIALHVHDTKGTALANVLAALQAGVATIDASCGGLGGCPYAPGAAGNLATEDLVYLLDGLGIESNVRLDGVVAASDFIAERIGRPLPSRVYRAAKATRHRPDA